MRVRAGLRRVTVALALTVGAATATVAGAAPAGARVETFAGSDIEVESLGWGHGRGLSQYGALGYAIDHGWSSAQILDHYYGGTTAGAPHPNEDIKVHLTRWDRRPLVIRSDSPFSIGPYPFAGGSVVQISVTGVDRFTIRSGTSCTGPFDTVVAENIAGTPGQAGHPYVEAVLDNPTPGEALSELLVTCLDVGGGEISERGYRGALRVVEIQVSDGGGVAPHAFAVNRLPLETYLRGVVPHESPASWGTLGGGAGLAALEAQAVAARSYAVALAESRRAGGSRASDTCDTTSCQVYAGAYLDGTPLDQFDTTVAAIANTSGIVRRWGSGNVALTEFSASSGGWTAPTSEGNPFGDVEDLGDDVALNPFRPYQDSIAVADIEAAYPEIGDFVRIDVTQRNGLGQWGGRVRQLQITGSAGTRIIDIDNWGDDSFRRQFGLRSDWYRFPDFPENTDPGFWIAKEDGTVLAFGSAVHYGDMSDVSLHQPIVGMAAHPSGNGYWLVAADGGIFSFGAAGFHGSTGDIALFQPIVGMAPHPSGDGYWMVASDGGIFAFGAAAFRGSMGAVALNRPVVGMETTASGDGYWMVASDGGIFAFGDAGFLGSAGSLGVGDVVGMTAHPDGSGYWFVTESGRVFTFGGVSFLGSREGRSNRAPVVGIGANRTGNGYWLMLADGTSYPYGDAPDFISSVAGSGVVVVEVKPGADEAPG